MRKFSSRGPGADENASSEVDLTPMLDIVFIMLIFFIVTASFVRETGIAAERAGSQAGEHKESEVILVRIDANDSFRIGDRPIDPRALLANLAREHALQPDYSLVIQPHRDSTTQALVAALDAAERSAIRDIAVADTTGE
jgi:biopolymer transport protein ExbD